MECNIDAKGKAARLIWGILCVIAAAVMAALLLLKILSGWGWWVGAAVALVAGLVGIWEARRGWCVVRGMGIKTPF